MVYLILLSVFCLFYLEGEYMLGFYNYTVILTYIGMISGFTGIVFVIKGNILYALICLMVAGICDMFDGKIAATRKRTKAEKQFGVEIDSLSDLICFGVLPGALIFSICHSSNLGMMISSFYVLCALIRLAWFNVDELQRQENEEGRRNVYLGLPVTTTAFLIPSFILAGKMIHIRLDILMPIVLVLIAIAFLTPFKIKKPNITRNIVILIGILFILGLVLCKVIL